MNSVLENRSALILKFPEHDAGKMDEYHCTLVKDDALAVWQSSSAETDWGRNVKLTHITVKKKTGILNS